MNLKNKAYYFLFLIAVLLNFSCQQRNSKSEIEIYTIKSSENENISVSRDSKKGEIIYAPKFEVTSDLINENPIITNDEILCLDIVSGKIELSSDAINKIVALNPSMKHGIKFAICQNKEPIFTGYFWSSFSSYGSNWNCIEYKHTEKATKPLKLNIYKGNGIDATKREKIDFRNYPKLLQYFQDSGKVGCTK